MLCCGKVPHEDLRLLSTRNFLRMIGMLRAQAFELGAAKWEFENARKAFGDIMRKFAPGGGAGHFLANAIARRTDRVSAITCSKY